MYLLKRSIAIFSGGGENSSSHSSADSDRNASTSNYEIAHDDSNSASIKSDQPVLSIKSEKADDFTLVNYRILTYAEVAAIKGSNHNRIEVPLDDEYDDSEGEDEDEDQGDDTEMDTEQFYDFRTNADIVSEMEYGDRFSYSQRLWGTRNRKNNNYPFVRVW